MRSDCPVRCWAGVDWGNEWHQVCLVDAQGVCLGERRFPHSAEGLADLAAWLLPHAQGLPASVRVAIERPHGPVVELLLQQDFSVYAVNPKQLDRFRDRHTVAGAKDDRRDALVLADSLRTDPRAFTPLQPADPTLVQLREILRVDEDLRQEENGLSNRLRDQLLRYFPALLSLMADRADPFLWALLEVAPTPQAALRLGQDALRSLLQKCRIRRLTSQQVHETLQTPALQVSEGTVAAATAHIACLIPRLRLVHQQRRHCSRRVDELLEQLRSADAGPAADRDAAPPQRCDATILETLPGVGRIVLATVLVEAAGPIARRDLQALRALGGIAPVTRRSGKQDCRLMRRACNARLRYAFYHWGRVATQHDPRARQHYALLRGQGHSHGRALRGVVDRLLSVAVRMLIEQACYDPARRSPAAPVELHS